MRESVCHHSFRESLCLFVAKKKQMDSPSIQVLQRSRDSAHLKPEPDGIDNPFNALDFRQSSLIPNPQAGCLASTLAKKMKLNRKRISILATILLVGYGGTYLTLRSTGIVTRYENRGIEKGNEVKAKISEWNDLIPSLGKPGRIAVNSINLVFFPLRRVEEFAYNLNT